MSKMILDKIGIMNTRSFLLTLVNAYSVIVWEKIKYQVLFLTCIRSIELKICLR